MSSSSTPNEPQTEGVLAHSALDTSDKPTTPDSPASSASSSTSITSAPAAASTPTPTPAHLAPTLSHSHDAPLGPYTSHVSVDDAIYDRLAPRRKLIIVALVSYCSFLAPISSTTVLSAVPEVAAEFGTTGSVVNISNALYMLFMGVSPCFWGPLSQIYGRRWVSCFSLFSGVWGVA